MFKRRRGPFHPDQLREWFVPRKGWNRGIRYLHLRLRRLPGSPHSIALGFAFGTLLSFTPLFGFHIFVAVGFAYVLGGNLLAAALGTAVGNPLTFPIIAAISIRLGNAFLGHPVDPAAAEDIEARFVVLQFPELFGNLFLPYLIGGLLLGLPAAFVGYLVMRPLAAAYQARRAARRRKQRQSQDTTDAERSQA